MPTNEEAGAVARAQRAIDAGGDTRLMKRELERGNPYIEQILKNRGLEWKDGAIRKRQLTSYHVNVTTEYERDFYVEAASAEEAEAKVRDMSRSAGNFWDEEEWSLLPEGSTDYFVEEDSTPPQPLMNRGREEIIYPDGRVEISE